MSTSATRKPAKMGDAQCSARALKLSIDKGIAPNISKNTIVYLEIYEPDILNSHIQNILEYASQVLLGIDVQDPTLSCN